MDNHDMRHEAIRRTLMNHARGTTDASATAEAILGTWGQVAARLTPVIGARGVDALFSRSLHLTSPAFPWLALAGDSEDRATLLANFRKGLETRETAVATEAGYALMVNFTDLLETLIGESLTERLLGPVLAPPPPPPAQETAP
jgi:hypothetical protein